MTLACGDRIRCRREGVDQGVVTEILPRQSLLQRSDNETSKLIAANVTLVVAVVAGDPPFSVPLLARILIAARAAGIATRIALNKTDLIDASANVRPRLAEFRETSGDALEISVRADPVTARDAMLAVLEGEMTVLIGQSGTGKSALVNLLVPDAQLRTQELSRALKTGRHTTTAAHLFALPDRDGAVIDTPGFREFGLAGLSTGQLIEAMPCIARWQGQCRFADCIHVAEPGCRIRDEVDRGNMSRGRYALYVALRKECRATDATTL